MKTCNRFPGTSRCRKNVEDDKCSYLTSGAGSRHAVDSDECAKCSSEIVYCAAANDFKGSQSSCIIGGIDFSPRGKELRNLRRDIQADKEVEKEEACTV